VSFHSRTACTSCPKSSIEAISPSQKEADVHRQFAQVKGGTCDAAIACSGQSTETPDCFPRTCSLLLAGLAVLMVVIMWLTGGKKPPAPLARFPAAPAVQAPLEVNDAKIVELQNRIQQLQREQTWRRARSRSRATFSPRAQRSLCRCFQCDEQCAARACGRRDPSGTQKAHLPVVVLVETSL